MEWSQAGLGGVGEDNVESQRVGRLALLPAMNVEPPRDAIWYVHLSSHSEDGKLVEFEGKSRNDGCSHDPPKYNSVQMTRGLTVVSVLVIVVDEPEAWEGWRIEKAGQVYCSRKV